MNRKLKMGMVGGGRGAFIGGVHRMAANLDGKIELVAGCFSSDPEKSKLSGEDLFLDSSRVYSSYEEMVEKESQLPVGDRIDFVSIVTRNNTHFAIAKTFLEAGINVICDKPMTFNLEEAKRLKEVVKSSGKVFALTHNYTGYPMVKEAREMIRSGKLGRILKVVVEYPQGYAVGSVEKQEEGAINSWRTNPEIAGQSNCIADIGIHAENLLRYMTGLEIEALCSDVSAFIPGAQLDDDGSVLLRFKGGAKGVLFASQISSGDENNLNIRVWGTKGSIQWFQEHPNELIVKAADEPHQIYRRGNSYLTEVAQNNSRTPFGHQEAFIEAFANVYVNAAKAIADEVEGKLGGDYDFPNVDDGAHGMAFIDAVLRSSKSDQKWTEFSEI
ncbi:MAG: Gfo/Idh/MocA family oxidoreductase [Opitutales bacterium]|nr:Gfo/Idh/MocA family oxidoreductase [Opitutales bacterium]